MIRIGLVGLGQIARKQHLPAIAGSGDFSLAGLASLEGGEEAGLVVHRDHRAMLAAGGLDAVAVCTPPVARFAVARDALRAGCHVLLEKPPGLGVAEVEALMRVAEAEGRSLFAAWHSQFNTAVEAARAFLAGREVASLRIDWNEDFIKYHPGQAWIWEAGGFGVFDMGINGLSVLSRVLSPAPFVRGAELMVAANHAAPIAAVLRFGTTDGAGAMEAHFDWRGTGPEQREVRIETTDGHSVELLASGGRLVIDGVEQVAETRREYPMLYARFAELIAAGASEVDVVPLQMTSDAFGVGRVVGLPAFGVPGPEVTGAATVFTVSDVAASLAYYRDVLGFGVAFEYGAPLYYACLCREAADLHLIAAGATARAAGQSAMCVFVSDVDALHDAVVARGAVVSVALGTREYGMRDFNVVDPDGNQITFGMAVGGSN